MIYLNAAVSLLTIAGLIASAIAWRHSLMHRDGVPEYYFAMGKVLMAVGIAMRLLLWDAVWAIGSAHYPEVKTTIAAIGGVSINIVSSAVICAGVYCSLRSRQMLIPEAERGLWPWWLAWAHPKLRVW